MTNLERHAENEMRRAGLFDKDADYRGMIAAAVMRLVKVHAAEGHSGFSHSYALEIFNKVANFKTLTPVTSDPSEWNEVCDRSEQEPTGLWQNNRCSTFFSRDGGKTWYDLDAPKQQPVTP